MEGIGISLVDDRPLELLYFLAQGITAGLTATATHRMLSITVDGLQVREATRDTTEIRGILFRKSDEQSHRREVM